MALLQVISHLCVSRVNALEQAFDEGLDFFLLKGTGVVSVDGVKDTFVDFAEFFLVDKDVC